MPMTRVGWGLVEKGARIRGIEAKGVNPRLLV